VFGLNELLPPYLLRFSFDQKTSLPLVAITIGTGGIPAVPPYLVPNIKNRDPLNYTKAQERHSPELPPGLHRPRLAA